MTEDFRPTKEQIEYFDKDLMEELQRQGIIREDQFTSINSIDWYNWDNDPRWFVHLHVFNERFEKTGYIEVDVYFSPSTYLPVDRVSIAGHGYPCIATTVVQWDKETDEWSIEGEEEQQN